MLMFLGRRIPAQKYHRMSSNTFTSDVVGFRMEYSEMNENIFTLKCSFSADAVFKPTREEMLDWLVNKSGLPEEYSEKITHVKYDAENINGFEVIFHESVNCLIALQEIENCFVYGKNGKTEITVKLPQADFRVLRLPAFKRKLSLKKDIVKAMSSYGEIIEIEDAVWHDNSRKSKIPTGDIDVHILTKKQMPEILDIGGENFKIRYLANDLYADEIMDSLWNNLQLNLEPDYKCKIFKLTDRLAGCGLICKFHKECDLPSHRDVYEWLTKESGLSEKYLQKIVAFKIICKSHYVVLFDATVNCLMALAEIKFNKVYDAQNVCSDVEVICPKGKFVNVTLSRENAEGMLLIKDVEDCLKAFGPVIKCKRSKADFYSTGLLTYEIKCKIFKTRNLPQMLKINKVTAKVIVADCEKEDYDEEILLKIWKELKI